MPIQEWVNIQVTFLTVHAKIEKQALKKSQTEVLNLT